jgi:hypothetical protein
MIVWSPTTQEEIILYNFIINGLLNALKDNRSLHIVFKSPYDNSFVEWDYSAITSKFYQVRNSICMGSPYTLIQLINSANALWQYAICDLSFVDQQIIRDIQDHYSTLEMATNQGSPMLYNSIDSAIINCKSETKQDLDNRLDVVKNEYMLELAKMRQQFDVEIFELKKQIDFSYELE